MAPANETKRDSGVSDAVWEQLQRDKQAAQKKEEQYQNFIKASTDAANDAKASSRNNRHPSKPFSKLLRTMITSLSYKKLSGFVRRLVLGMR